MVFLLWWTLSALASPLYPPAMQEALELDCAPPCTVCHNSLAGGAGTVTQPFGQALMERGLEPGGDVERLLQVLDEAHADGQDSAGDGTPDIEALQGGVDPNPGGQAFCDLDLPVYGCVSHTGLAPAWVLALLGLGAGLYRGRARPQPR